MSDFEPNEILRSEPVNTANGVYQIVYWREIDDEGNILRDFLTVLPPGTTLVYNGRDIYTFIFALQNHPVALSPELEAALKELADYTFGILLQYLPMYNGDIEAIKQILAPTLHQYRQAWPNFYT